MLIKSCSLVEVQKLCTRFHGYGSAGDVAVYSWAVFEDNKIVACYSWQPPPPGAAKSVCPEAPYGVLALSRMVAVPKNERLLKHVSKPLKKQMKNLIDRNRWPVLITYSDESQGHNGYVYQCSGWEKTTRTRVPIFNDIEGHRSSNYSNGKMGTRELTKIGHAWIQRWEDWICARGEANKWMEEHNWIRYPTKHSYRNGGVAYRWIQKGAVSGRLFDDNVCVPKR